MLQGTPPTVMVRSEERPVNRFRPVMVKVVPPALGPRPGDIPITDGSWEEEKDRSQKQLKSSLLGKSFLHFRC